MRNVLSWSMSVRVESDMCDDIDDTVSGLYFTRLAGVFEGVDAVYDVPSVCFEETVAGVSFTACQKSF